MAVSVAELTARSLTLPLHVKNQSTLRRGIVLLHLGVGAIHYGADAILIGLIGVIIFFWRLESLALAQASDRVLPTVFLRGLRSVFRDGRLCQRRVHILSLIHI